MENQSRRDNLIFQGIEGQGPEETWDDCKEKVVEVIKRMGVSIEKKDIARAHRLKRANGINPIIAKFERHEKKEEILRCRTKLKATNFFVDEDFSEKVGRERKFLREEMKKARKRGEFAFLSFNKLRIEDKKRQVTSVYMYNWEKATVEKVGEVNFRRRERGGTSEVDGDAISEAVGSRGAVGGGLTGATQRTRDQLSPEMAELEGRKKTKNDTTRGGGGSSTKSKSGNPNSITNFFTVQDRRGGGVADDQRE